MTHRPAAFAAPLLTAALVVFCALAWAGPASAGIFFHINVIVTTSADNDVADGACSLREAIIATRDNVDYHGCGHGSSTIPDDITFAAGITLINVLTPLPDIANGPLNILGGDTRVELHGPGGTSNFSGLTIAASAPGTLIYRLVINNFADGKPIQVDAANVTLRGNFIGTNAAGTARMNSLDSIFARVYVRGTGVHIGGTNGVTPGGSCTGDCNLISGNANGIVLDSGGANAVIEGNFIGTDVTGTASIGNNNYGVFIFALGAVVGGPGAGQGNLLSGNGSAGILVLRAATVQGNLIGTAIDGTTPIPNNIGIQIQNPATNSTIGGTGPGEGNVIANSSEGAGVLVDGLTTLGNQISGNSIHDNTGKGIELINGGNNGIAPPVILATGSASGTACPNCTIDVYSDSEDEGRIYEGTVTANGAGVWSFSGPVTGPFVTATATDAGGNTSEFSAPRTIPFPTPTPSPTPTHSPSPTPTHSTSPTPTTGPTAIQGDADCDGDVDGDDVVVLLDEVVGLDNGNCANPAGVGAQGSPNRDVNCDRNVTPLDALDVLLYLADLPELHLPIGCPAVGDPLA